MREGERQRSGGSTGEEPSEAAAEGQRRTGRAGAVSPRATPLDARWMQRSSAGSQRLITAASLPSPPLPSPCPALPSPPLPSPSPIHLSASSAVQRLHTRLPPSPTAPLASAAASSLSPLICSAALLPLQRRCSSSTFPLLHLHLPPLPLSLFSPLRYFAAAVCSSPSSCPQFPASPARTAASPPTATVKVSPTSPLPVPSSLSSTTDVFSPFPHPLLLAVAAFASALPTLCIAQAPHSAASLILLDAALKASALPPLPVLSSFPVLLSSIPAAIDWTSPLARFLLLTHSASAIS